MTPSGRIATDSRPKIDYDKLNPPIRLAGSRRRLALADIDPYIRSLIEKSYTEHVRYVQVLDSLETAKEFARQCNAYARLREPEISVGVHVENNGNPNMYHVRLSAGPKIRRKRKDGEETTANSVPVEPVTEQ